MDPLVNAKHKVGVCSVGMIRILCLRHLIVNRVMERLRLLFQLVVNWISSILMMNSWLSFAAFRFPVAHLLAVHPLVAHLQVVRLLVVLLPVAHLRVVMEVDRRVL